ncbi:hypothetical protein ISN45_Aa03g022560, partial [Arabidopsis thaliana x Arabidopsis arenosa]
IRCRLCIVSSGFLSLDYYFGPRHTSMLNPLLLHSCPKQISQFIRQHHSQLHGIYYDDLLLSFSTSINNSSLLVANYTVPRFYQGHEKKAKKWGQVLPLNNQTVFQAVLPNGSAIFRVELKMQVKYKVIVNLEVNEDGATKVKNKEDGIKMKISDSSPRRLTFFQLCFSIICVLMNWLVFLAIC